MKKIFFKIALTFVLALVLFAMNCSSDDGGGASPPDPEASRLEDQPSKEVLETLFAENLPDSLSDSWKIWGHHNALITQGFGADPTVMVYKDRIYIYASNDSLEYTGSAPNSNTVYSSGIQGLRVLSSSDLANWTDHGLINVGDVPEWTNPLYPKPAPVTPFQTRSWAPSAVWKKINGKDKFFIYFADSGNGIGVISADSPTGPWTSPLNDFLITRSTPNCADVTWLFDPGVMVDDDGKAYMYFGGGDDGGVDPGNGRRVQLGADMISLAGDPEKWMVPCLFEDNEITNIEGLYYYSYSTNGSNNSYGLQSGQIAYMTSPEPLGTYSDPKGIMRSPQIQFGTQDENNHHCIFQFKDETYIAYHASNVARAMGLGRYRSTQIDKVEFSGALINTITMTRKGVDQIGKFDPYARNEAETIGIMGGVYTRPESDAKNGMLVTSIDTGDWLALYGVNFGTAGASKITVRVRMPDTPADYTGAIELRLDPEGDGVTADNVALNATTNKARIKDGEVIGRIQLKAKEGEGGKYAAVTADLYKTVTGVHDLVFVFYSSLGVHPETVNPDSRHKNGFEFDQWQFK